MSAAPSSRRTVAEINFGDGASTGFNIGNRSIHQFWHLFSAHFRGVLLAPQRRPDSGKVAWTWREPAEGGPPTPQELASVRQRLTEAHRLLTGGIAGKGLLDEGPAGGGLDAQVREKVSDMVAQLTAQGDAMLAGFVCRTETGPMVHSWGAASPAKPHYPGLSEGVLGGTVFLGADRTAGLTVVLENRAGGLIARTKSGEAGAFSFPNVAPGNYRLRVTGRGEFPAGGIPVTMERESITGLELRGNPPAEAGSPPPASSATTPAVPIPATSRAGWRIVAGLALLLVLGGGGYFLWRAIHPIAGAEANGTHASGWQSAGDQVGGPAGPETTAESRPVGRDEHWSDLKPAPALPGSPRAADHARSNPSGNPHRTKKTAPTNPNSPTGHTPAQANSASDELAAAPVPSAGPEPADKNPPDIRAATEKNMTGPKSLAAGPTVDPVPAMREQTDPTGEPDDHPTIAGAKKTEASATKAQANTQRRGVQAGFSTALETQDNASAAGDGAFSTGPSSATSGSSSGAPMPSAAGKNPGGSGANESARGDEASTAPAAPDAAAAGNSSTSPPGRISSNRASPAQASAHPINAESSNTSATTDSSLEADAGPAANETTADPAASRSTNPPAPAKRPAGSSAASNSSRPADAPPDPPTPDSAPATPPTQSAKPASKRATAPAGKPDRSDIGRDPAPADAPDPSPAASATPASLVERPETSPSAKPPRPRPSSSHDASEPVSGGTPGEANASNATPSEPSAEAIAGANPLVLLARVSATGWKTRQVRDLILPTRPVPASEEEAVGALREKLRQEQDARLPPAFKQPVVTSGFTLEFPSAQTTPPPGWVAVAGAGPNGALVEGNRAELAWSGADAARNAEYILRYPDGKEIARVRADADGAPSLKVAAGVRGWYWVGVSDPTHAGTAPRLRWRLNSGAAVPSSWAQTDRWNGGRGYRLELPLGPTEQRPRALALMDPLTGWALTSEISVGQDR